MADKKYLHEDITDSAEDQEKLKSDKAILDLPELKDIPGATRSGKNTVFLRGDTTISSADEEGDHILDDDEGLENGDVSPLEKKLLRESFDPAYDIDLPVHEISLDARDNEGELLEEADYSGDLFGKDLDSTLIKEEDEETEGETDQQ
jgi:hypothetical protein